MGHLGAFPRGTKHGGGPGFHSFYGDPSYCDCDVGLLPYEVVRQLVPYLDTRDLAIVSHALAAYSVPDLFQGVSAYF